MHFYASLAIKTNLKRFAFLGSSLSIDYSFFLIMKVKVTLYVAGKVFDEVVQAANYDDARRTALARNPTAKIIAVNAVFN